MLRNKDLQNYTNLVSTNLLRRSTLAEPAAASTTRHHFPFPPQKTKPKKKNQKKNQINRNPGTEICHLTLFSKNSQKKIFLEFVYAFCLFFPSFILSYFMRAAVWDYVLLFESVYSFSFISGLHFLLFGLSSVLAFYLFCSLLLRSLLFLSLLFLFNDLLVLFASFFQRSNLCECSFCSFCSTNLFSTFAYVFLTTFFFKQDSFLGYCFVYISSIRFRISGLKSSSIYKMFYTFVCFSIQQWLFFLNFRVQLIRSEPAAD